MKIKISVFLVMAMLLISCNRQQETSSNTPISSLPDLKDVATSTPVSTRVTATSHPLATTTSIPTITFAPSLTPLLDKTKTPNPNEVWMDYIDMPSPDGEWVAYYNLNEIKVVQMSGGRIWTLPCDLFERCTYVMPVQWSLDSDTLYFGASTYMGGAPNEISLFSTAAKLDVVTGQWSRLFPDTNSFFDFAISSDGSYITYVKAATPPILYVLNLKDQSGKTFSLSGEIGGNIVWSPYKPRFVFQIKNGSEGVSVIFFDVETEVLRYLIKAQPGKYYLLSWLENNLIYVRQTDEQGADTYWYLDPFASQLTPAPTPTP